MRDEGFRHGVQLMQSSGGMATVDAATQRPVNLLMSGPVAGLIGGIWAGKVAGYDNVVTLDMGGTSADIGVAAGGQLRMRHLLDTKIGDYQAMVPMVDIDTIGAGGGSIAYVDEGGVFRVGPQSAGADPGPACYGRGGAEPTSTDAQLLLGRLRPDRGLLGGQMQLDLDAARSALEPLAERLDMSVEEAALGALQIQKYGMAQSIELNSVRRGYDPREVTLVAAGGAGPLFACARAPEPESGRGPAPPHPGLRPAELARGDGDPSAARTLAREVVFDVGGKPETLVAPFYEREQLRAGDRVEGPAVIEQYDTTTVIPPGLVAEIDRFGNIVIDCSAVQRAETGLATPILMRVIGGAFAAIAKEMAGVLYRMSYSSIIRESEDLGAGIFDPEGNELAESDSTPMFMGAMPKIVKGVISLLGDDLHDRHVLL